MDVAHEAFHDGILVWKLHLQTLETCGALYLENLDPLNAENDQLSLVYWMDALPKPSQKFSKYQAFYPGWTDDVVLLFLVVSCTGSRIF